MEMKPEVIRALEKWAESHPKPDKKIMAAGFDSYTPRELLEQVKGKTALGQRFYKSYERAYLRGKSKEA